MTNLTGHQYSISDSVFNLKRNGLPLVHPISLPRNGSLSINSTQESTDKINASFSYSSSTD